MAQRSSAYVDTSALIAFADRSDSYHSLFRRLFAEPPTLLTTVMVLGEGQGWFLKRYDRFRALQFVAMVSEMPFEIISVGSKELGAAAQVLRRFSDQNLTLVDAVGLEVMTARKVTSCWSTDFHLGLTGVPMAVHRG